MVGSGQRVSGARRRKRLVTLLRGAVLRNPPRVLSTCPSKVETHRNEARTGPKVVARPPRLRRSRRAAFATPPERSEDKGPGSQASPPSKRKQVGGGHDPDLRKRRQGEGRSRPPPQRKGDSQRGGRDHPRREQRTGLGRSRPPAPRRKTGAGWSEPPPLNVEIMNGSNDLDASAPQAGKPAYPVAFSPCSSFIAPDAPT